MCPEGDADDAVAILRKVTLVFPFFSLFFISLKISKSRTTKTPHQWYFTQWKKWIWNNNIRIDEIGEVASISSLSEKLLPVYSVPGSVGGYVAAISRSSLTVRKENFLLY